ncbi:MAG: signal peptide peptidase SppA, partial [bacterium]|nr:signal peptide peptidase SppA [bacterium]
WFYKEIIDKFGVDVNIFRVGKYKSAVEPYLRKNMSDEAKEANLRWLNVLWDSYLEDVSAARKLDIDVFNDYVEGFNVYLKETNGNAARVALEKGLVDQLTTRDQVRKQLIQLVGENKNTHSFNRIGFQSYLAARGGDRWGDSKDNNVVAVIMAKGEILHGYQPPGKIGGESTAASIRKVRQDD